MLFVMIIAVSVGGIVYLLQRGSRYKEKDVLKSVPESRPEPEKALSPGIRMHNSFKDEEADVKPEEKHTGITIYKNKEGRQIWVCPNCETENRSEKEKCCVCGRARAE